MTRVAAWWTVLGWLGLAVLPWYGLPHGGLTDPAWLRNYPGPTTAPALWQGLAHGRPWLLPLALPLVLSLLAWRRPRDDPRVGAILLGAGALGLAWMAAQGLAIGLRGWSTGWLAGLFGGPGPQQPAMGYGAGLVALAFLMLLCHGFAARGCFRGDAFLTGATGLVVALITLFVFFPIVSVLVSAVRDEAGAVAPSVFFEKLLDRSVWGLDCLTGPVRCGVAWNTLFLASVVGAGTTLLGLAFALVATRTAFPLKGVFRALTVLPIITPPFVIGVALILLFGRSGAVTAFLSDAFGLPRTRWLYGFPGVFLAQVLAFTPIAFLVLIGVVQGISPSLEEAAQTLRARSWTTFRTVSWPLMRPGIANAFLLGFVESMADFGNPLVLSGNYEVLSVKVFFAVVGAAHDQGRAAVLALVLLGFTLGAFYAQHRWLGRRAYTTVTGKGDAGLPAALPRWLTWVCYAVTVPWTVFTLGIYGVILAGGFVRAIGRDYTLTFQHYLTGFAVEATPRGLHFTGAAWNSFWTTLEISAISAPLTAAAGLLTAYLLARQSFAGKRAFEFGTMLSFAIPGTVIGVSYILAFNVPPVELTGTGAILVICFVFRNMPVGVRSGIATLSQIDRSLDEASLTLGARSLTTVRRVVLPLLRPALVAALVYSFVRAMTAVSAVIFLVSAQYNLATAYIVGRVEAGEFGLAIAYSSALIVVMLLAILLIQVAVGERRLGRRAAGELTLQPGAG
ncbi:MAG TPA: iron ABC transporter permease [Methylomirabilota bacterium]|jgi:iron(III) transport system permease protein|nr:iron ABC transporter permease [Methylomirabilota bacterium]